MEHMFCRLRLLQSSRKALCGSKEARAFSRALAGIETSIRVGKPRSRGGMEQGEGREGQNGEDEGGLIRPGKGLSSAVVALAKSKPLYQT